MAAVSAQKKRLDDIEKDSERIKRDYDQYFLGLSKRPPTTAQAQFAGHMRKIKEEELREWGTSDRFRFNQIHARFVALERVWAREMKQIEDGTHKRDKLKRRPGEPGYDPSTLHIPPEAYSGMTVRRRWRSASALLLSRLSKGCMKRK